MGLQEGAIVSQFEKKQKTTWQQKCRLIHAQYCYLFHHEFLETSKIPSDFKRGSNEPLVQINHQSSSELCSRTAETAEWFQPLDICILLSRISVSTGSQPTRPQLQFISSLPDHTTHHEHTLQAISNTHLFHESTVLACAFGHILKGVADLAAMASRMVVAFLVLASICGLSSAQYDPMGQSGFEESHPNLFNPALYNVELYRGGRARPELGYNAAADPGMDVYDDVPETNAAADPGMDVYEDVPETTEADVGIAASAPASQFVTTRGQQFYLNGRPLFVNGANLYYLMTLASDPSRRWLVTQILKESASVGVTVVRAWAFADGEGAWNLQMRPGVYSEATFRVRMILCTLARMART